MNTYDATKAALNIVRGHYPDDINPRTENKRRVSMPAPDNALSGVYSRSIEDHEYALIGVRWEHDGLLVAIDQDSSGAWHLHQQDQASFDAFVTWIEAR